MWNFILTCFQYCCHCNAATFSRSHLCRACKDHFQWYLTLDLNKEDVIPKRWRAFPLITLGSYKNSILNAWIHSLKGGGPIADFDYLARELLKVRQLQSSMSLFPSLCIVPSPSRRGLRHDHAGMLALALSRVTGWPVMDVLGLSPEVEGSQKQKAAIERQARRFELKESVQVCSVGGYIFIDDVVTTGSTAAAAWKALGYPENYEVWCMAYQPKLAGGD